MSSPMYEMPEHLDMPINADGGGPETNPELVARVVCWECGTDWPCEAERKNRVG